ncbi:uncharacterized protein VTP21DRAFT_8772 [Calcarisporiella thermophila]|uniref:uncharacterized protein n=1 Tax=Calcarisporiella thermophila TaxID=911321 RepID=UPI003742E698
MTIRLIACRSLVTFHFSPQHFPALLNLIMPLCIADISSLMLYYLYRFFDLLKLMSEPFYQILVDNFFPMRLEPKNLHGKTVLVTGGNRGIGLEISRALAQMEAHVIMAYRACEGGEHAAEEVRKSTGNQNVEAWPVELTSFKSVRELAARFLKTGKPLDILVNNAGIAAGKFVMTEDGFESTTQINYLSHFLLTHLLMPALEKAPAARVVNLASCAHYFGKVDLTTIRGRDDFGPHEVAFYYGNSKLYMLLFARELARRARSSGSRIVAHAVHPGLVASNIWNADGFRGTQLFLTKLLLGLTHRDLKTGAMTPLHAAISDEAGRKNGEYWESCRVAYSSTVARDPEQAKKLWAMTTELLQLEE